MQSSEYSYGPVQFNNTLKERASKVAYQSEEKSNQADEKNPTAKTSNKDEPSSIKGSVKLFDELPTLPTS